MILDCHPVVVRKLETVDESPAIELLAPADEELNLPPQQIRIMGEEDLLALVKFLLALLRPARDDETGEQGG